MAGVDIEIGDQRVRFHESRYAEKGTRPRVSGIFLIQPVYIGFLLFKKNYLQ